MQKFRRTGLYLIPVVLSNALPLVTLPIFTRVLTKEDYGAWALAQVYAIFVSGLANFGLNSGFERNYFEQKDPWKATGLLYSTLLFVAAGLTAVGLVTWFARDRLAGWVIGTDQHGTLLFWSYCTVALAGLKQYYLLYFKNAEDVRAYVRYSVDESVLGVVFSLAAVVWLRLGVLGLVWGQLAGCTLVTTTLAWRFARAHPFVLNRPAFIDSLKLSLPLTPRIFFGVIGTQLDKYLIGLLGSLGGVGIYSIAQKVAYAVFMGMTAIQNVYSPQVYRRMFSKDPAEGEGIGRYLTPYLYFSAAGGLLVAVFAEEIVLLLTPESFHGAADIITILTLLYVSYFFGKQPQLIYAKKTVVTSMMTLVSIALNVAINIPFIQWWGAMGAAWGTLLAGAITGAITFSLAQHYYRIHWEYRKVAGIFLLLFGSAACVLLMRQTDLGHGMRLGVKAILVLAYGGLGYVFGLLTPESLQPIVRALGLRGAT